MDKTSLNANTMLSTLLPQAVKGQKAAAQNSQIQTETPKKPKPAAEDLKVKKPSIGVLNPGNINTNYSVNDIFQKKKVDETDKSKSNQAQQTQNGDPAALGLNEVKHAAKQGGLIAKDLYKYAVVAGGVVLGAVALRGRQMLNLVKDKASKVSFWFKTGEAKEAVKKGAKQVQEKTIPFFREQSLKAKNFMKSYITSHDELNDFLKLMRQRTDLKPQNVTIDIPKGDKGLFQDVLGKFKDMAESFGSFEVTPKIQVVLDSADDKLIEELKKCRVTDINKLQEGKKLINFDDRIKGLLDKVSDHTSNVSITYDIKGPVKQSLQGITDFIDDCIIRINNNKKLRNFFKNQLGIEMQVPIKSDIPNVCYEFVDTRRMFNYIIDNVGKMY